MSRPVGNVLTLVDGNLKDRRAVIYGKCDYRTSTAIALLLNKFSLTPKLDIPIDNADVVFQTQDGLIGYLDAERSKSFRNGIYHSPKYLSVSIPVQKADFLQLPNAYWCCFDWELKHFIVISGEFILLNSTIRKYASSTTVGLLSSSHLYYFMVPLHMVTINSL